MEEKPTSDTQTATVKHVKEVQTNWFLQLLTPTRCCFLMPLLLILTFSLGMVLQNVNEETYFSILFLITYVSSPLFWFLVCMICLFEGNDNIYAKIITAAVITMIVIFYSLGLCQIAHEIIFLYLISVMFIFAQIGFLLLLVLISCVIYLFKKGSSTHDRIMSIIAIIVAILCWPFVILSLNLWIFQFDK